MSDFDNILSPAGRSRRDEILAWPSAMRGSAAVAGILRDGQPPRWR